MEWSDLWWRVRLLARIWWREQRHWLVARLRARRIGARWRRYCADRKEIERFSQAYDGPVFLAAYGTVTATNLYTVPVRSLVEAVNTQSGWWQE